MSARNVPQEQSTESWKIQEWNNSAECVLLKYKTQTLKNLFLLTSIGLFSTSAIASESDHEQSHETFDFVFASCYNKMNMNPPASQWLLICRLAIGCNTMTRLRATSGRGFNFPIPWISCDGDVIDTTRGCHGSQYSGLWLCCKVFLQTKQPSAVNISHL